MFCKPLKKVAGWFHLDDHLCDSSCDNRFKFCADSSSSMSSDSECSWGSYQTVKLGSNDITFDTPIDSSRGIPNPMKFTGSRWPVSGNIYLHAVIHESVNIYIYDIYNIYNYII